MLLVIDPCGDLLCSLHVIEDPRVLANGEVCDFTVLQYQRSRIHRAWSRPNNFLSMLQHRLNSVLIFRTRNQKGISVSKADYRFTLKTERAKHLRNQNTSVVVIVVPSTDVKALLFFKFRDRAIAKPGQADFVELIE